MSETTATARQLVEMEADELREWLTLRRKRLVGQGAFVQCYLDRRAKAGKRTHTDRRSRQFQVLAADLLQLLDELLSSIDQDEAGQANLADNESAVGQEEGTR